MTDQPTLHHVQCPDAQGGHRMAWWQWGDAQSPHVVMGVHGLTRQGRDFDVLAQALLERAAQLGKTLRVVCVDVVGRGESDWLKDPMGYGFPTYAADMLALLGALHGQAPITTLDWVGTSMGGLIGMTMAGTAQLPLPVPIRRLVLNDVGPAIEWVALERIGQYVGKAGTFASVEEGAQAMRALSQSFGPHTDEQWMALSRPMFRPAPEEGRWRLHYDPALAVPYAAMTREAAAEVEATLWQLYDAIRANTLVLRGAESDLLSRATVVAMGERGPQAHVVEFAGVGHAPTLIASDQVRVVLDFLLPVRTEVTSEAANE
ncbi:alpha/beta fold hydrolase [Ottowia sp.]|uniref:alpha/beta fold hydrolase n=1 Tax=Ottowia sp. TaxID=1898956 RepID=UPI003A83704C